MDNIIYRILLSLTLGAFIGLERGEKDIQKPKNQQISKFTFIKKGYPATGLGGVRTYTLVSLLGAIGGLAVHYHMMQIPLVLLIILGALISISYFLNYFDKNTFGLTTEISIFIVFTLSLLLVGTDISTKLIIALFVVSALILSLKHTVRGIASKFSQEEIIDIIKFALVTIVILPLIPNKSINIANIPSIQNWLQNNVPNIIHLIPAINPYKIWMVVVFICSVNFIGYFLVRMWGGGKGLGIMGLLGGLISSTAITEAMAIKSKESKNIKPLILATLLANLTSFMRIFVVATVINFHFGIKLFLPMLAMTLFLILWTFIFYRDTFSSKININNMDISFKSPFAIKPALNFAFLFTIVYITTYMAKHLWGDSGFVASSIISSFSGLDAIVINTTESITDNHITIKLGLIVIVAAAIVNLLVKVVFSKILGSKKFTNSLLLSFILTSIAGIIAMLVVI